jgi:hypothetical protein
MTKDMNFELTQTKFPISGLLMISCLTVDKSLNVSVYLSVNDSNYIYLHNCGD